ncbi:MAG: radical SAM protein [Tenericutes bacterium]|nr:radical SAM protein [Mycoplasmatota bacterium]
MQYNDIKSKLIKSASKQSIPVLCEFELTSNCNFSCPMCYVCNEDNSLSTKQWISIFDEAIKNGMLFANMTGGEIFVRKDFNVLYEYLFDKGIKITLFSNGSIIPKETLELLSKKKPHYIAITLYGYDSQSYESFTKSKNSYENVISNIQQLKESNINTLIRTIPIKNIYDNLDKMIHLAKSLDMNLYYLSYVTKTNLKNLRNERLNAKELIDFEKKINQAFNYKDKTNDFEDDYKSCSALRATCFINHKGYMQPCALGYNLSKSIIENDFLETFKKLGIRFRELEETHPCRGCEFLNNCSTCVARRLNEEGNAKCSKYLKEVSITRSNLKYLNIAGIIIGLDYQYNEYFENNIEKYLIDDLPETSYNIRTHLVDTIELPKEEPDSTYSTRLIYGNGTKTSIYALDEEDNVMQLYKRSVDLKRTDIYLNKNLEQNFAEKEYVFSGIAFLDIAAFNGMVPLHGAGIICNNEAIIFSAPSKVGKTTHTKYWLEAFQDIQVYNEDKPVLYKKDNVLVTSGTPWSGKSTLNMNITIPLHSIVFLEQGKTNELRALSKKEKMTYLMRNILRPREEELWQRMFPTIDTLLKDTPMYLASVTNDLNSAKIIRDKLLGGNHEN